MLLFFLLLSFVNCDAIGQADKAGSSNRSQSDLEKFNEIKIAAENGDVKAQMSLAVMYSNGLFTPRNQTESAKWIRKAADQGCSRAQRVLAEAYEKGVGGVTQDEAEAVKWTRRAAEQGDPVAQAQLGKRYFEGRGVQKSNEEALKWFRFAADQNQVGSQIWLGNLYSQGLGLPRDLPEALKWFHKAAEQRHALAQRVIGIFLAQRVPHKVTPPSKGGWHPRLVFRARKKGLFPSGHNNHGQRPGLIEWRTWSCEDFTVRPP